MSIIIPSVGRHKALNLYTNVILTLKLYSNNYTPIVGSTTPAFTEVAGGGYVAKTLLVADWTITVATPSIATQAAKDFQFTGVTSAPATIYGWYIVDPDGLLRSAERFAAGVVPFIPINGSLIRVTPRFELG